MKKLASLRNTKGFYGWYLLAALWIIYCINVSIPTYGVTVINSSMATALNWQRSQLGLGLSVFQIFQGLAGPLVSLMLIKKGIKNTLLFGTCIMLVSSFCLAVFVNSQMTFVIFYGVFFAVGVAFGGVVPVMSNLSYWFDKRRALSFSIISSATGVGVFLLVPAVNKIIAKSGWASAWYLVDVLFIAALILIVLMVVNNPAEMGLKPDGPIRKSSSHTVKKSVHKTKEEWLFTEALKTRSVWFGFISSMLRNVVYFTCIGHSIVYLQDIGFTPAFAGMSIAFLTLFGTLGRLVAGLFGDRVSPRLLIVISQILIILGVVFLSRATSRTDVYLFAIFMGSGFGLSYIIGMSMVADYYGAKAFSTILGVLSPIFMVLGSFGPLTAGIIYDRTGSYSLTFKGLIILMLLASVLILFARIPIKKNVRLNPVLDGE